MKKKYDNSTLKKINRPVAFAASFLLIPLGSPALRFRQTAQAVSPPPDGAIPAATTAEGMRSLASQPAAKHGHRFLCALLRTQPATTTRHRCLSAFQQHHRRHSTRPWAYALFKQYNRRLNTASVSGLDTQPAYNTAAGFHALFSNTTATSTRPSVLVRSKATPPARATRPSVLHALYSNTTGSVNTAIGFQALSNNTTGTATRPSVKCALSQHAAAKHRRRASGAGLSRHNRPVTLSASAQRVCGREANRHAASATLT